MRGATWARMADPTLVVRGVTPRRPPLVPACTTCPECRGTGVVDYPVCPHCLTRVTAVTVPAADDAEQAVAAPCGDRLSRADGHEVAARLAPHTRTPGSPGERPRHVAPRHRPVPLRERLPGRPRRDRRRRHRPPDPPPGRTARPRRPARPRPTKARPRPHRVGSLHQGRPSQDLDGTTPTRVGSAPTTATPPQRSSNHPHARGEHLTAVEWRGCAANHPHARGEHPAMRHDDLRGRTTPTRVGSTGRARGANHRAWEMPRRTANHPHARGEHPS